MAKRKDPEATKIERTGKNSFNVKMEDGSSFQAKTDPRKFKSWGNLATKAEKGATGDTVFIITTCPKCGSKWHIDCSN